jgi:hypothetical protein
MVTISYVSNGKKISYEEAANKNLPFDSLSFSKKKYKLEETTCDGHTSEMTVNFDIPEINITHCCDLSLTKW